MYLKTNLECNLMKWFSIPCLYTETKVHEPVPNNTAVIHVVGGTNRPRLTREEKNEDEIMTDIGNYMKRTNILSEQEVNDQMEAIHDFRIGKLSYAEMRMRAG